MYADEAETGTKDSRPEFQRLIADCQASLIDMVITKSISRFPRNTVTLLETVRDLKERGIGVYFDEQKIYTDSSDGELMLTILASYAQEESRSASENQKWRIRKDYNEGKSSNYMSIYGYDHSAGELTVIPEEAKVVQMIFNDYLAGLGINAIMKKLIRLKKPTKRGEQWTEGTVWSILKNEKFTANINAIRIPADGILVFKFKDNTELALTWENPSRRESWTDEMKQAARERALERRRKNG